MKNISITLTAREILDLAEAAGFVIKKPKLPLDEDSMQAEFTIFEKEAGVVICDDDGTERNYAHGAYLTEYPEEGTYALGDERNDEPSESSGRKGASNAS